MALDNLISIEFSSEELKTINDALVSIGNVLRGKSINLSPDERRQYGSIADRNKVFVDKCKTYMEQDPTSVPRTLNKAEFDKDYLLRRQLDEPLKRLSKLTEMLSDTKTLADFDNYTTALAYYNYVKFLSTQNEPGISSVFADLKSHFAVKASKAKSSETPTEE